MRRRQEHDRSESAGKKAATVSRWKSAAIAAALVFIVSAAVYRASELWFPLLRVVGDSMQPSVTNGDVLICHDGADIGRGDVIAFRSGGKILVKRVIGVSGDTVSLNESGQVLLNGQELSESYVRELSLEPCDTELPVEVPEGEYFVLGDRRSESSDSRTEAIGTVSEEQLIGKVVMRPWPPDRARFF